MSDVTYSDGNITENVIPANKGLPVKAFLSMTPCLLFLYINGVMLFTLRKKAVFRETSRYILFAHMLCVDTFQLLISLMLYMFAVGRLYFVGYICLAIVIAGTVSTRIAPLNLALMSLERYVAICFPLRHAEIASSRRTSMAIGVVWVLGSANSITELIVFFIVDSTSVSMKVCCSRPTLFLLEIYKEIDRAFTGFYFVSVTVIIFYTYISIIVVAKSASSKQSSVSKAHKTVLLHLLQLGLCLASLLHDVVLDVIGRHADRITIINVRYVFFFVLIILPRCLSPLIYGLRDQTFSHLFKNYFTFGLKSKVKPLVIKESN